MFIKNDITFNRQFTNKGRAIKRVGSYANKINDVSVVGTNKTAK